MEENKTKRLSYDELENIANQLSVQLQQAKSQMGQMSSILTKLPYLFKVVELGDGCFSTDFVVKCTEEIEEILNPKEDSEDEEAQ